MFDIILVLAVYVALLLPNAATKRLSQHTISHYRGHCKPGDKEIGGNVEWNNSGGSSTVRSFLQNKSELNLLSEHSLSQIFASPLKGGERRNETRVHKGTVGNQHSYYK